PTPPQACNRPMSAKRGCVTDCCRGSACYSLSHANGAAARGPFPSHGADDDFRRLDDATLEAVAKVGDLLRSLADAKGRTAHAQTMTNMMWSDSGLHPVAQNRPS